MIKSLWNFTSVTPVKFQSDRITKSISHCYEISWVEFPDKTVQWIEFRVVYCSWTIQVIWDIYLHDYFYSWWPGWQYHFDGLVHERRNSIANALELRLSCTDLSISWYVFLMIEVVKIVGYLTLENIATSRNLDGHFWWCSDHSKHDPSHQWQTAWIKS